MYTKKIMKEDELKDFETIVDTIGPMQFVC